MGSWISVKDKLPDEGINVLVWGEKLDLGVFAFCYIDDCWAWCNCYGEIHGDAHFDGDYTGLITHWMPLPEPPVD